MFRSSPKFQGRDKSKVKKKWRLFHATDFQSLMLPCFTFCRILGIFPYKSNCSNFEASKPRYILSSIVFGVQCIYFAEKLYRRDIMKMIQYDGVPDVLQSYNFIIISGFITIITYILSGPRMRSLQTVMEVSSALPPKTYDRLSKILHAKDMIGFFFLFGQIVNCRDVTVLGIIFKLFALYSVLLIFQMDMLYMNCVCVLKACFQRINDNLTNLRKLVINNESHRFMHVYRQRANSFLLVELKMLQKWHLMISDTVQMLNVIFTPQLLASIIMTFAEITFSLYFYIVEFREKVSIVNLNKQIWYSYITTPVTYYFIKLALIVWSCETGKTEALKIGTTVHDVLVSTTDKQVKEELQLFSLQVLHRDNTFCAKGLTIDMTFLTAIVGSITTYLLILVQFMDVANNCDGELSGNVTQIFEVEEYN
ncbi:putative gustatory receptor 2a [Linepithema humile]|uniref:putative gustatory receptor 2a n=1 Tax=Linepithema humile TaxID=83485 RepID=UPI0006231EF5|nr:PREDICTED: uncharacterized protein LOC105676214 [Linepithema humile]